jgi:ribonuclease P protein subunit POP4
MISEENILVHEIIGLNTKVVESADKALIGLHGTVVFESKNMITIRTDEGKLRKIAKISITKLAVYIRGSACFISGSGLIARPEDRI